MPKKKPDELEPSLQQKSLEHRVDAMMSTELARISTLAAEKLPEKKTTTKEDTIGNQKTAPNLPAKLLKSVESSEASEAVPPAKAPIVIALTDDTKAKPAPVSEDNSDANDDTTPAQLPQAELAQDQSPENDLLEDNSTNEAVDDIVAKESDTVLAVGDALIAREQRLASPEPTHDSVIKHKWTWFLLLVVLFGTIIDFFIFKSH